MYDVTEYRFGLSSPPRTAFWWTRRVRKAIERRDGAERRLLLQKLRRYAKDGFERYEGGRGFPIKHEWGGVRRIGSDSDLFRIIGFYGNNTRSSFIAIDAFLKKGQNLTSGEKERINEVARVRRDGDWKQRT